jgi:hypothetical protein
MTRLLPQDANSRRHDTCQFLSDGVFFLGKIPVLNCLFPISTLAQTRIALRAAVVLGTMCTSGAASAQWSIDAQATRQYESNLSHGQTAGDVASDSVTKASVAAGRELFALADASLALTGEAAVAKYDRFSGLSNASLGATLTGRSKLGLGLTAPWMELSAAAARDAYRATQRNGYRYAAALTGGRRFSEAFDAQIGARYDQRRTDYDVPDIAGTSGRAFDLQGRSLFAQANLAISDSLAASLGINLRRGDLVSTARETPAIWAAASAITSDPAFGENRYAYRSSGGTTRTASLALSWTVNAHASINGSVADVDARARDGFGYRSKQLAIQYVYSR